MPFLSVATSRDKNTFLKGTKALSLAGIRPTFTGYSTQCINVGCCRGGHSPGTHPWGSRLGIGRNVNNTASVLWMSVRGEVKEKCSFLGGYTYLNGRRSSPNFLVDWYEQYCCPSEWGRSIEYACLAWKSIYTGNIHTSLPPHPWLPFVFRFSFRRPLVQRGR